MSSPLRAAEGPPVFVVGSGRSGTTMLRLMLDAHPRLAIPPESHFIPRMWAVRPRYERDGALDAEALARDIMRSFRFREWALPEDAVWEQIRRLERPGFAEVIEAFFLAYAEHHGKRRWGDKTPGYVLDMALLAELFPDARFVHLVRDGRDVARSFLQQRWARHLPEAAEVWAHRVRLGRRIGRELGPSRYVEIRYEDLVDRGEPVLAEVCAFIGLDLRPEMLRYYERKGDALSQREHRHHEHEGKPPTKGLRDWRRDMPAGDVAVFEAIAGDALSEFGYERAHPRPPARARMRAGLGRFATAAARTGRRVRHAAVRTLRPGALPPPRRW